MLANQGRLLRMRSAAQPASEPARMPPAGLDGLDPAWSRLVKVGGESGYTWHLLDNGVVDPRLTLLCVHGNPSWSYLWRKLIASAPADVRVVAVDQLEMGFSERKGIDRPLATRVEDLCALTDELKLTGPVVTVAHDWGGPISLGWALRHLPQLQGVVLHNTSVHQPEGSPAPSIIRFIRQPGLLRRITTDTQAFITGAIEMSRPRLSKEVQTALRAPYLTRSRRRAIATFVEDIPLDADHPSAAALEEIAEGLGALADTPALLLWGPKDPVFSDLYLHDLEIRLPHAQVHRYPGAGHFVSEDRDVVSAILDWLDDDRPAHDGRPSSNEASDAQSLLSGITNITDSEQVAVVDLTNTSAAISFGELDTKTQNLAVGLRSLGVSPGDRVAIMIPPGVELTVCLYACWRLGAIAVLIDSGLGPKGMTAAMNSSAPEYLIGIDKALAAARTLRWPGKRISVEPLPNARRKALGVFTDLVTAEAAGASSLANTSEDVLGAPDKDKTAAVVFTSGSTGPSKGVIYRHYQLQAQRDALRDLYSITNEDRLVAAFAPFALFGPALGISSVVPDMDVTAPRTLTAPSLAIAAESVDATLVFASPAALKNVVDTAGDLSPVQRQIFEQVRLVMSAGAPIHVELLTAVAEVFPNASLHTPYGMTEILPVADISLTELQALDQLRDSQRGQTDAGHIAPDQGVCVGYLVAGVEAEIQPLSELGVPFGPTTRAAQVTGQVVVRARHARERYDRLWHTTHLASQPQGWHRSGDVGHLDSDGRLWIEGRVGDVVSTTNGPMTPVSAEQAIECLAEVHRAAVVGVGPAGTQQVIAVVELTDSIDDTGRFNPRLRMRRQRPRQAPIELTRQIRTRVTAASNQQVSAVLVVPRIPVDRRHNSKIDRGRIRHWADSALSGGTIPSL